jgi:hypothetical protein
VTRNLKYKKINYNNSDNDVDNNDDKNNDNDNEMAKNSV